MKIKKHNMLFLMFTLGLVLLSSCQPVTKALEHQDASLSAIYHDRKSAAALKFEQFELAETEILAALETEPNDLGLKMNLAILFDYLKKTEQADKSFADFQSKVNTHVLPPEDLFKVLYNLGVFYGKQKKVEQALEAYQAALDLLPTSVEVKTNIELLIQQQQNDQKQSEQNKDQQNKDGKPDPNNENKDQENKDDKNDKDKKDDKSKEDQEKEKNEKDREQKPKYQPRPYQGDQLTEGDVKKILGELSQQDKKIRSQFNKKEQNKKDANEKDW